MKKKQIKKEQEKMKLERNYNLNYSSSEGVMNIIYISGGVLLFILLIFVFVNVARGNWNIFSKNNNVRHGINEDVVMCGNMFQKDEDEYLVLAYDFNDDIEEMYVSILNGYPYGLLNHFYSLDLKSGYNKSCVADTSNIKSDLSELKISQMTLLSIKEGKIDKYYEGREKVLEYFKDSSSVLFK